MSTISMIVLLAVEGSGQGQQPDKGGGAAVIIGIVVALVIFFAALFWLIAKRSKRVQKGHGTHSHGDVGRL